MRKRFYCNLPQDWTLGKEPVELSATTFSTPKATTELQVCFEVDLPLNKKPDLNQILMIAADKVTDAAQADLLP